jgi:hypothetical protein
MATYRQAIVFVGLARLENSERIILLNVLQNVFSRLEESAMHILLRNSLVKLLDIKPVC